jgi:predicted DNA binding CopG/RHH family protein
MKNQDSNINIRIESSLLESFRRCALSKGRSVSELLRAAMRVMVREELRRLKNDRATN